MRSSHTAGRTFAAGSFAAALVAGAVLTAPAALADPIGEGNVPLTLEVVETGSLSMTVDTTAAVELVEGTSADENRVFNGTLPTVTVTDDRSDVPENSAWYVVGQSSDFVNEDDAAAVISAEYLGWAPALVEEPDENESVGAGSEVVSSVIDAPPGDLPNVGLTQGTDLLVWTFYSDQAQAVSQEYKANAELELLVPADEVESGTYNAVLTLSLFEDELDGGDDTP